MSSSILHTLKSRFEKNVSRHLKVQWTDVEAELTSNSNLLHTIEKMESTGGEPDVLDVSIQNIGLCFVDFSMESPSGRRSLCYDKAAWIERKENKPEGNVLDTASEIGITLLDEALYRYIQQFGPLDMKTSSWIATPESIRKLGGALFSDFRYGQVFTYHNGAQSYYAARGFRGFVRLR